MFAEGQRTQQLHARQRRRQRSQDDRCGVVGRQSGAPCRPQDRSHRRGCPCYRGGDGQKRAQGPTLHEAVWDQDGLDHLPIEGHLRKRLARNELPGHSVKYIVEAVLVRLHDYFAWLSLDRKCRAVELRFFGGLSVEETAEVLKVSPETVHRDWRLAKAWLTREMGKAG